MKKSLTVLAVMVALVAAAERRPFDRYQSIVDRQMFGVPPPGFDPTRPPSEVQKSDAKGAAELTREQEQLKSAVHFSVINVTPDGATAVGFTDNSDPKSPKHYYLRLGDERDGWLVKEADPVEKSMLIVKGAVEVSLKLGENSAGGGGSGAQGGRGSPLGGGRRGSFGGLRGAAPGNGGGNADVNAGGAAPAAAGDLSSLRGRRLLRAKAREEDEKAKAEAAARKAEEERQAAEEKERLAKEREEQRAQLQAITEELRRAREASQAREQSHAEGGGQSSGDSE